MPPHARAAITHALSPVFEARFDPNARFVV
jgi:hypothetical protein